MNYLLVAFAAILTAFYAFAFWAADYWLLGGSVFAFAEKKAAVSVGVIVNGSLNDGAWNESLAQSLQKIDDLPLQFSYVSHANGTGDALATAVETLVKEEKADIIITPAISRRQDIAKIAAHYPDVKFFYGGTSEEEKNISRYLVRLYQCQYQAGMLAAAHTKTNHLAIVIPESVSLINASVNAFTLGARSIKPHAVVHIVNTGSWNNEIRYAVALEEVLSRYPIDVVGQTTQTNTTLDIVKRHGLKVIGVSFDRSDKYGDAVIGTIVWDSENFWRSILKETLEGRFLARTYFASLGDDLRFVIAKEQSAAMKERIYDAARKLRYTNHDVFYGPIVDNKGKIRIPAGSNLSDKALISSMDWYVEGVQE